MAYIEEYFPKFDKDLENVAFNMRGMSIARSTEVYEDVLNGHPFLEIVPVPEHPGLFLFTVQGWTREKGFEPVTRVVTAYGLWEMFKPAEAQVRGILEANEAPNGNS